MELHLSLFDGQLICLTPIDHDKDPEVEARWTQLSDYQQMLQLDPARPASTAQIKKKYEAIEKDMEEGKNSYYFAIRTRAEGETPERLVGFAQLYWIEWNNQSGQVLLGIGDPADRRKGYGREALDLVTRFAFDELNLYRLQAHIPEYNTAALRLFGQAGYVEEVRRREALHRFGRRWDMLLYGLLSEEWRARRAAK